MGSGSVCLEQQRLNHDRNLRGTKTDTGTRRACQQQSLKGFIRHPVVLLHIFANTKKLLACCTEAHRCYFNALYGSFFEKYQNIFHIIGQNCL